MRALAIIVGLCALWFVVCGPTYKIYANGTGNSGNDGHLLKVSAVSHSDACAGPGSPTVTGTSIYAGDYHDGSNTYSVYQAFFSFTWTDSIPAGETITDATMYLYVVSKGNAPLYGLRAYDVNPDYAPLDTTDWKLYGSYGTLMDNITYANLNTGAYNAWDLTNYCIGENDISVMMVTQGQCDGVGLDPGMEDDQRVRLRTTELAGQTQDPYLEIVTEVAVTGKSAYGPRVDMQPLINGLVRAVL